MGIRLEWGEQESKLGTWILPHDEYAIEYDQETWIGNIYVMYIETQKETSILIKFAGHCRNVERIC